MVGQRPLGYFAGMPFHRDKPERCFGTRGVDLCVGRFGWVFDSRSTDRRLLARDPAPNDPDVHPIREPEPEPDSPEPEPGDEPERIDPVRTMRNTKRAILEV